MSICETLSTPNASEPHKVQAIKRYIAGIALMILSSLIPATVMADNPRVLMQTNQGDIVLQLFQDRAPKTVENFLGYVDDSFYNDTLFHRVIEGFMIQGGGFTTLYHRKQTRQPVSNEAYNGLRNTRYSIAMARTTAPHSATSQFFINTENNRNLDHTGMTQHGWGYTVFGKVIEGHAVVDAISQMPTRAGGPFSRDVPAKPVVILSVSRLPATPAAQAEGLEHAASPEKAPLPMTFKPALTAPSTAESTSQSSGHSTPADGTVAPN